MYIYTCLWICVVSLNRDRDRNTFTHVFTYMNTRLDIYLHMSLDLCRVLDRDRDRNRFTHVFTYMNTRLDVYLHMSSDLFLDPPKNGLIALWPSTNGRVSTFWYCQVVFCHLLRLLSTDILVFCHLLRLLSTDILVHQSLSVN